MKLLDRYIMWSVIIATIVVVIAFSAISTGLSFVGELKALGKNEFTGIAFYCALLSLPRVIHDVFPIIMLLGTMLGLGSLAGGSELIVMRASGVSLYRITRAALLAGLLLAIPNSLIGEYVMPRAEALAARMRIAAENDGSLALASEGLWLRDGDSFIHIDTALTESMLKGVQMFRFGDDRNLQLSMQADAARFQEGSWQLTNVKLSEFGESRVQVRTLPSVTWNTTINPHLLRGSVMPPDEQTLRTLYETILYLGTFGLDADVQQQALWRKLAAPVMVLVMTVLAVPFVVGPLRSTGAGQRMFFGSIVGASFFFINELMGSTGLVYGFSPFISAWLPTVLVALVAIAWLAYTNSSTRFRRLTRRGEVSA